MSILIKGMEMPRDCGECRFGYDGKCFAVSPIHRFFVGDTFECPLIEIPPHGRLIDADELTELCDAMADKCDGIGKSIWGQFRATVEWLPTIIEAEESDG